MNGSLGSYADTVFREHGAVDFAGNFLAEDPLQFRHPLGLVGQDANAGKLPNPVEGFLKRCYTAKSVIPMG
jgi:hypothetical protein